MQHFMFKRLSISLAILASALVVSVQGAAVFLSEAQAKSRAIAILVGDPYGKTESEVSEKIVKAAFLAKGSNYCGKKIPSWVFTVSVPESSNQSKFEGPLVIDARSGAMLCAGLPFLD